MGGKLRPSVQMQAIFAEEADVDVGRSAVMMASIG
jgi:hypothetical protein